MYKIYIASMNMRDKWADPLPTEYIKINVTSAQAKNNKNRIAFSPMTHIVGGYKGYYNFEHYWQSGKIFKDIPENITKLYWKELKEPKRRYPKSKGKKVLYSKFECIKEKMDYITSRKKVYIPEYYELIKNNETLKYWKEKSKDNNLIIYDFDGPRDDNNNVLCLELTKELLINKINYEKHPFGHGYIVAASIMGITPNEYI